MKKMLSTVLFTAFLLPTYVQAGICPVAPLFVPRSQSVNAARELVGLTNHICIFDMEKFYGTFAITPEYTRSFKDEDISHCLFGDNLINCDCQNIRISGSAVQNRCERDWLADYFGLPIDFESCLSFEPRITNFLADFYLYLGLDEWLCGLFFFIHAPVVNTRWDLNFCEGDICAGTMGYPAGYFTSNPDGVPRSRLRNCFSEYVSDCEGLDLGDDVFIEGLKFARMCPNESRKDTALSDIRFALGWNFFQDEDYHLGLGLLAAAPTGTRPDGEFFFEPIVGNGHHWEFGGLVWGHVVFWRSECEEKYFAGWIQGNITHMFNSQQCRFFDLKCKPLSRYMLAECLNTPVELLLANEMESELANSTVPSRQFKNLFAPVANITAQRVDVSIAVQADIVAMLTYTSCGFTWDLGYNFWARTCEKIEPNCDCPSRIESEEKWALKGNAYVFGFSDADPPMMPVLPVDTPVALSATQSNATIHRGTNIATGGLQPDQNSVIDFRQFAVAGDNQVATDLLFNKPTMPPPVGVRAQTGTSKDPVLLTCQDIDIDGARTKGLTHKVFTHFSYSWLDNEDWTPYLGAGAEVEFGHDDRNCPPDFCDLTPCIQNCEETTCPTPIPCFTCCDDCQRCSLSQWGVWVKGGVSFN